MALLQRTRTLSQQRIDLPDYRGIEDFVCADFKAIHKNVWTNQNFVFSGFEASGTGTSTLSLALPGSSLVVGQNDGVLYIGASSLSDLETDDLTPGSTNFVELIIEQDTGGADSRAFWDQTAGGGVGGEFSQIVDTFIFNKASFRINTASFTGDADKVSICEVDVNGSGIITAIRDGRDMFFRLGRKNNPGFSYSWASRTEPTNTQFTGADKDIRNVKQWFDAIMDSIRELKGTTYWYEAAGSSLVGLFRNAALSFVTALGNEVSWKWDGSALSLQDTALSPVSTDTVAAIRLFDSTANILLTRQQTGQEVQKLVFSAVPTAGSFTLNNNGNITGSIAFNASNATILSTCNAAFADQLLSVTGDFSNGLVLTFLTAGNKVQTTVNTNTLTRSSNSVTITPSTVQNGFTGSTAIALADGEVLWVELPNPLANTTISGTGVTSINFRISPRGSVPNDQDTYWIAYREGSNVYLRGLGELEPGQISEISDDVNENILKAIGITSETALPQYASTNIVSNNDSLVTAVSKLDAVMGTVASKLIGGGTITNTSVLGVSSLQQSTLTLGGGTLDTNHQNATFRYADSRTSTVPNFYITEHRIFARKVGSPTGNLRCKIYSDSAGLPGSVIATSDPVSVAGFSLSNALVTFNFSTPFQVLNGALLYYSTEFDGGASVDGSNYIVYDTATVPGGPFLFEYNGSIWAGISNTRRPMQQWGTTTFNQSLAFTDDMYLEVKGLDYVDNTIDTASSPIVFSNDFDTAYVIPNKTSGGPNLAVTVSQLTDVPSEAVIIARRVGLDVIVGSSSMRLKPSESKLLYKGTTDQQDDIQRGDKTGFFRSDDFVTWTGTQIEFTSNIVLEMNNQAGTTQLYSILAAGSPIILANGQYAYITVNRNLASETVSVSVASSLPAQPAAGFDIIPLAKRLDAGGVAYLHLPFQKQLLTEGQSVRLGASGSGSSSVKAVYLDPVSTVLPTGTSYLADGIATVNGDTILFTKLGSNNNRVYKISGVGTSIAFAAQRAFNGQFDPTDGDSVRVQKGNAFGDQLAVFNGTNFLVNDVVRQFDGVSGNFFEQSSLKTMSLANNTTAQVFSVSFSGSENMLIDYSIIRSGLKETGKLFVTTNGTTAKVAKGNSYIGDPGISFSAAIVGPDIILSYTSTNTGSTGILKYSVKRWSDAAGGPTGIPDYGTGGGGGGGSAAGNLGEVQFNGPGNLLDTDARFKWDSTEGAIDLNGLKLSALSTGITLNDNQVAPATVISFMSTTYSFSEITYSIVRNGILREGTLIVMNDASLVDLSDEYRETDLSGVTFSAAIVGPNVNINYTTTNTGFTGTLKVSVKKWL